MTFKKSQIELEESRYPHLLFIFESAKVLFFLYLFLISISLMGISFQSFGADFTDFVRHATGNPFAGLLIGIVVTSVLQSSSTTTSIIVAMVGSGALPLQSAIPIVMGANIGTTVTCVIVSFGYVGRKIEFERSFSASIMHDVFNISATLILFPLELYTGIVYKSALYLETIFAEAGGFTIVSPLKFIINPVADPIAAFVENHILLLILALFMLFFAMSKIVENMKGLMMEKIEKTLNTYLFRNALISLMFGMFFTALVQSTSITTSILVPLAGAGLLSLEQIFPYTLGANLGTTITAILAALSLSNPAGMVIAFAHLVFNFLGIAIIYPIRALPIRFSRFIARFTTKSKKNFLIFIIFFISLHILPIVFAFIW